MVGSGSALLIRIQLNNSDAHGPRSTIVGTGTELINTGNYFKKKKQFLDSFALGSIGRMEFPLDSKVIEFQYFVRKLY